MSDIHIYEVGPRDGLQNLNFQTPTAEKIDLIKGLHKVGLRDIEITSFVHPKLVPNMADAEEVFTATKNIADFGVLIPNQKGFDRATAVGAKKMNVFFSPSESFNQANLGRSLDEALSGINKMLEETKKEDVRAYVSCAFGCPIEGKPSEHKLLEAIQVADSIADTVVLCDTIGAGHPSLIRRTLELSRHVDADISLHLHHKKNKRDNMYPNIKAALDWGVTQFDGSIGGLGGCPFIPDSGSNLSTNDLVRFLHKNNYDTGLEISELDIIAEGYVDKHFTPHTPYRLRVKNRVEKILENRAIRSKW